MPTQSLLRQVVLQSYQYPQRFKSKICQEFKININDIAKKVPSIHLYFKWCFSEVKIVLVLMVHIQLCCTGGKVVFKGLSERKFKSSKIRTREKRRWRFRREGLEEWVSIYELSSRALVKEHSQYSHDPNCFPKHSWLIQFMERRMCYTCVGKSLLPAGSLLFL